MASSLLQLIGLSGNTNATGVPNYGPAFILANWAYAYCLLSTRLPKRLVNIDHNTNPREDIARYGVAAVAAGKISRARLDRIKRMQAAHENAVEGFPFFVAALLLAMHAQLPASTINFFGAWYSLSRLAYGAAYILIENESLSFFRSLSWWSGNISCITTIVWASNCCR